MGRGQTRHFDERQMNVKGIDLVEVFDDLAASNIIAARGTNDLRVGTKVNIKQPQGGKS